MEHDLSTTIDNIRPSSMDNLIFVSRESLIPLVSRYFDEITPSQWTLLFAGILSPDTEATLAAMMMDMIQSLCADVLRVLCNTFKERISQAEVKTALEDFGVQLGDSLEGAFAGALDVTREKCPSMENLAKLVQGEVSQKIEKIIPNIIWKEGPVALVSGSVSSTAILHRMVLHASTCLEKLSTKLKPTCKRLCCSPQITAAGEKRCGSKLSVNSKALTKAVTSILVQRSRKNMEKEDTPSMLQEDAEEAASEIVSLILEDNSTCNIKGIFLTVRDLLALYKLKEDQTKSPEDQKRDCCRFAQKQFAKMILDLKNGFNKEIPFLGKLVDCSGSSEISPLKTEDSEDFDIPGTVPETRRPKSVLCTVDRDASMIRLKKVMSLPFDFALIKNEFEELFNKLKQPERPASSGCTSLTRISEVSRFSQDLTNKIYSHLVASQTCRIPEGVTRRSLSDSVVYGVRWREDATHVYSSPEVLYDIVKQSVGRFVQQVLLWMEPSQNNGFIHDEQVSGALNDIEDMITRGLSSLPSLKTSFTRPESPKACASQTPRSSVTTPVTFCHEEDEDKAEEETECPPTEKKSDILVRNEMKEVYTESAKLVRSETRLLVSDLMFRLLDMASKRKMKRVKIDNVNISIERLSKKVQREITVPRCSAEQMNWFSETVIDGVIKHYGCKKLAVNAAVLNNTNLDYVILKNIRLHHSCLHNIPPKETPVNKFLSSVKEAKAKTFRRLAAMIFKD